jgi:hypothetical protein
VVIELPNKCLRSIPVLPKRKKKKKKGRGKERKKEEMERERGRDRWLLFIAIWLLSLSPGKL